MPDYVEKPLHGLNIASAVAIAVETADLTLFGGAGLAVSAALSVISLSKRPSRPTRSAASLMAPILEDELRRSPLSDDQKKVVLQLLKKHAPTFTDIAEGSRSPARIAEGMRQQIEKRAGDPAERNAKVLNTYQAILAAALEPVVVPTDQQTADIAKILQQLDDRGEHQRMRDEGITEKTIMRLASRITREAPDLGTAWATLEDAVQAAIRVQSEGEAQSNHPDFVDQVLSRTAALAAAGDYAAALDEIDDALEEEQARRARLLSRGIDVARLAGDARRASVLLVQQMELERPAEPFEALRALWHQWFERGRDAGLVFDATVAIHLARLSVDEAANADQRGSAMNDLGTVLATLGARESGTARLEEAVAAYRAALEKWTRDRVPLDWAGTQNNLGNALSVLGARETGTARLEEAVTAYRAALEERTRDRVPLDWAATQNNLGTALQSLGERETGTARLEEAVAAYRAALKERTRDRVPLDWAATQNNLGTALRNLGERGTGTARLEEAVAAYRAALEESPRDRVPLDWAGTQNNLGAALQALGERETGTARLEEAVTAYRAALKERTRDRVPLDWARTQNNLGAALQALGQRETGTARLEEAVTAHRAALEERTRDRVPLDWARTQNNLGAALQALGQRETGTARLEEAVTAYRAALEEWTRDPVPLDWAGTQLNLALLETAFFDKTGDPAHLDRAEKTLSQARAVFVAAGASHYVERSDSTLADIHSRRR